MRPIGRLARSVSLVSVLLLPAGALATPDYSNVVVIGDSLSDTGNLFGASGGNIPPSPPYAGGVSNGPLWPIYFSDALGLGLDNRAVAGATTGTLNTQTDSPLNTAGTVFDGMKQQFDAYAGAVDAGALHVIWGGSNNFLSLPSDPAAAIGQAVSDLSNGITQLAVNGAAHFAVANLPNFGQTPRLRELGTAAQAAGRALSVGFNAFLDLALDQLEVALGLEILRLDVFGLLEAIVADPTTYGFTNATERCLVQMAPNPPAFSVCAQPDEYLFWDDIHPTTAAHQVLAANFLGVIRAPEPASLALLVLGLAGLGASRRAARSSRLV